MTEFEKEVLFHLAKINANTQQTLVILERLHPEALKPSRRPEIEAWHRQNGSTKASNSSNQSVGGDSKQP